MATTIAPAEGIAGLDGPHGGAYRAPAIGLHGVVSAAHGLAATAGLRILVQGGNAVDAAIAVGAALSVVEPFMSGLGGGSGFMLIHEAATRRVWGLDYVGLTPAAADPTPFANVEMLGQDVRSSTVPGTLGGWLAALNRFGTMDRAAVFAPAIDLAERGWPITPFAAQQLRENAPKLSRYPSSVATYLPNGRPPTAGEVVPQADLARTYRTLAEGGAEAFYHGDVGRTIVQAVQAAGGWLTAGDLAAFEPRWLEPLSVEYGGRRVYAPAPPSTGFQYLESLKMLEAFDLPALGHNSAEYLHLLLETVKLASADRTRYLREPTTTLHALLTDEYAAERRAQIDRRRAAPSEGERYLPDKTDEVRPGDPGRFARDHTTHFDVADQSGNVVSVTQTNGALFGNGFVVGDTGIPMNNLLYWTDLGPASPNYLRPCDRRFGAMSPCIVTDGGRPVLGIGTPGSFGILQTTLQMLLNVLDFGMHVQAAIEAPRFRAFERTLVDVESRIPAETRKALIGRGHEVRVLEPWTWKVGGGHGIALDPASGVLTGGADPRRDGQAVAW